MFPPRETRIGKNITVKKGRPEIVENNEREFVPLRDGFVREVSC